MNCNPVSHITRCTSSLGISFLVGKLGFDNSYLAGVLFSSVVNDGASKSTASSIG